MSDGPIRQQQADSVYDQELANLLSTYTDRIIGGEELTLEDAVLEHPKFESDLRELWGVMVVTQAAGHHQRNALSGEDGQYEFTGLELPFELGDYTLKKEIGRGGMGIVYQATRKSDGRAVAIKMILKGEFATKTEKERFRAEAEAARRLNHPNIIPIYDIGEHEGLPYFCMQLIEGQTLSVKLLRGPMLPRKAATIMASISDAMAYAHEHGVLHRDLKPSNIILDNEGVAHLADFGLAKAITSQGASLTRTGAILGTPSYMSPEQASGSRGNIGTASDIYSLGAILYHMLTGHAPFLGATPVETVLLVIEQSPIPLRTLNHRVDRNLEMVTLRCLQKPQDLRYQTALKLRDDLRAFLDGRSVSAREGRFLQIASSLFRDTHHAEILENWGLLWMWHSLVLLVASLCTYGFHEFLDRLWILRRRMGPVTFVERQMAHVWAAAMGIVIFLFPLEWALELEALQLAPVLALVAAMVFLVKAGILSGQFYIHSATMFLTALVMMLKPEYDMIVFGIVSAGCFFLAGLKYYRRKKQGIARRKAFLN